MVIALLTDFGLSDTYVGQMKGVIAAISPATPVIDLTHAVEPGAIEQGAFLLETALGAFAPDTVFVAVVDPGVGTERRPLLLTTSRGCLVGPDNGLLSGALPESSRPEHGPGIVRMPGGVTAIELAPEPERTISATFHGRDLFAVAAARLAAGADPAILGKPAGEMIALPPFRADHDGELVRGRVVHIDRFGNIITTIPALDLPAGVSRVQVGPHMFDRVVRTYGDVETGAPCVLVGSSGYLEIACRQANAAAIFDITLGATVEVYPQS